MRKLKKVLAVVTTAVMTMAMGVSAFADTEVTFHFYNVKNWDNVGAWVKQNIDWSEECLPTDKCVTNQVLGDDGITYTKPLWPGAKMEEEGNGWYKVTCTFTNLENGAAMIFNNYVGDSEPGDTTSAEDIQKLRDAGVPLTDTASKDQTANFMIRKGQFTATEYWIEWDTSKAAGSTVVLTAANETAPASYVVSEPDTSADNNTNTNTDNGAANTNNTNNTGNTGTTSGTTAPTTGDAVAVSVVALGLAAVVAVVAAKKKANA